MKVTTVMIFVSCDETHTEADIEVEGLGDVTIKDCLTPEIIKAVKVQVKQALRAKLKVPLEDDEEETRI